MENPEMNDNYEPYPTSCDCCGEPCDYKALAPFNGMMVLKVCENKMRLEIDEAEYLEEQRKREEESEEFKN